MITYISIDSKSIEYEVVEIPSRSMSDSTLSGSDFKNGLGLDYPYKCNVTEIGMTHGIPILIVLCRTDLK